MGCPNYGNNSASVWIVDHAGKRAYGSQEALQRRLESSVAAMLEALAGERNDLNDLHAAMYAHCAAHWALALAGE